MNTICTEGSCEIINKYLREGGTIFDDPNYDKVIKLYLEYLKSTGIQLKTISRKSSIVYLFIYFICIKKENRNQ